MAWIKANIGTLGALDAEFIDRTQRQTPVTDFGLEEQVKRAFEELRVPVYRYLIATGGNPTDADDLTQETFLRLYRHLHAGHRIDNLRAWIFRVAHNLWIDSGRVGKYTVYASQTDWDEWQRSRADESPSPEALVLQRELMDRLDSVMAVLTEKQRQSLHLRAEGFTYREIAEILGVSISTVVDAVRRAVEKLGKVWNA